jgi:hypothetical protein
MTYREIRDVLQEVIGDQGFESLRYVVYLHAQGIKVVGVFGELDKEANQAIELTTQSFGLPRTQELINQLRCHLAKV